MLCLTENVIACLNQKCCVAFKVVDVLGSTDSAAGEEYAGDAGENMNSESSNASKASCGGTSRNSFETDSLETSSSERLVGFPGRTPVDFHVARMVNSACGRNFEAELKSQWEHENENCAGSFADEDGIDFSVYSLRNSDIKIKLINEAKAMNVQRIAQIEHDDATVQYDIRRLLQIGIRTTEAHGRSVDVFRCMDLKAIYQRSVYSGSKDHIYEMGNQQMPGAVSSSKHANRRTLKSSQHQDCIAYALLVASCVDGYLYQFCAQGKWYNENEKPIASYAFTAPVLKVHLNDYVLYAITAESVETHTSRIGHKLFNNRFEYPTIGAQFPEESSPDVNAPIAVIGLASFMHVQFVCVNRDNLILISNSADVVSAHHLLNKRSSRSNNNSDAKRGIAARLLSDTRVKHLLRNTSNVSAQQQTLNEWTLYNLALPSVESVVEDLEAIAESYRAESSGNFYDLMEEAHVMLRMSLSLQHAGMLNMDREHELRKLFMNNCRKLADFSIK